jgi:RNase P subunit RPR2
VTHAAETGCDQRIALRDHIVEGHPTIGSDYVVFLERPLQRLLTCRHCLERLLPFCHRHVRFDGVCNETILMCSVMHLIEFFCTGPSVAAPRDLRA